MAIDITVAEIRAISGAPSTLIPDADITVIKDLVIDKAERFFQVKFDPTKAIEILTGGWKDRVLLDEYFPLKLLEVRNGDTVMDLTNLFIHTEEGMIEIYGDTIQGQFSSRFSGWDVDIKIKYLYGAMERDTDAQTESAETISIGTTILIEVDDSSDFTTNDFVFFEDLNRAYELAQITAITDSTHITVDQLVNDYELDTLITKAITMEIFNQYVLYESAIVVANNSVGGTYALATGYTYPKYSVQKGVPWTHWQNNLNNSVKLRDAVLNKINAKIGALV